MPGAGVGLASVPGPALSSPSVSPRDPAGHLNGVNEWMGDPRDGSRGRLRSDPVSGGQLTASGRPGGLGRLTDRDKPGDSGRPGGPAGPGDRARPVESGELPGPREFDETAGHTVPSELGDSSDASLDWDELAQFGPLAPYVAADGVTDVFVNGAAGLWVDAGHGTRHEADWRCDERTLRGLAVRLVALGGRHVDESKPVK